VIGALESHASFRLGFQAEVSRLVDRIVSEAGNVDQVLAVLDNALMFALAHRVAAKLGVSLVTLVWDSPGYLLSQAGFDRWSRTALLKEFSRSLAASSRVGVVSETMRTEFASMTESPILIFRHGTAPVERTPSAHPTERGEWVICFAGSMYAPCAWRAFQAALDLRNWTVAGRPVRLRLLTSQIELRSQTRARVEFLGICDEDEMRSALSSCDLAYLPQPFSPQLREVSRFSFPTKLSNYLALGLPVFVHSPPGAAISEFFLENPCGGHADSLDPEAIAGSLDAIFANADGLADAREMARRLAAREFSDASFRDAVASLMGGRNEAAAALGEKF
jgi:hypothetical protein